VNMLALLGLSRFNWTLKCAFTHNFAEQLRCQDHD